MSILLNCSQVLLTTRNVLIANLAVTDLLLSTTAIPLTLLDVIYKYWPLGEDMVRIRDATKLKKRKEYRYLEEKAFLLEELFCTILTNCILS